MLSKAIKTQEFRYLMAGVWNTGFGYVTGLWLYFLFKNIIPLWVILSISNIISITVAFITYKLFVFKKRGNWILEYCKSYLVYGFGAIITSAITIFLVNNIGIEFWLSQGFAIGFVVCITYIGHKKFTFK